jgi:hypothetical protein
MTPSQGPGLGAPSGTFTAEQANRMLPLVGRIVADVVAGYRRWQELVDAFELAAARSRADEPDAEAVRLQREAQQAAAEVEGFLAELEALGVQCKSPDVGLVDFPAEHDGRTVYLCWRLGEPSVQYWHEVDAGFAGRRPLARPAAR